MSKTEEKTEVEKEVKESKVEVEYGEIVLNDSSILSSLRKLFDLYIGIDENFAIMPLKEAVENEQKKFIVVQKQLNESIFGEDRSGKPEAMNLPEDAEDKKAEMKKRVKFGQEFVVLCQKKITFSFPEIKISRDALKIAMEREVDKKEKGTLLSTHDLTVWSRFIKFI